MKPDWKAFGECILERFCEGDLEIDMADVQEWAVKAGVLIPVEGGFNPERHIDVTGYMEPGDEFYSVAK
ncbi:hypothetical protein [uncultured Roseibium sp.]|uniref:hypothetical protein n=1 Tax=uncultured Roseibium sp. TaxID=1936171 RepID=UPI00262065F4|nr:hypothetical protein [uncultured Roseibium sp.]